MRFLFLFLIFAFTLPVNAQHDIYHYNFDIEITDKSNEINGVAGIIFLMDHNLPNLTLDLSESMQVNSILHGSTPLKFTHDNDQLIIAFTDQLGALDTATVVISYKGTPADGLIISENKFGDRTFFGDNWPNRAHNWLPVIDHPSDKALVTFSITAPAEYSIIANGLMTSQKTLPGNRDKTTYETQVAVPTKVMVFGAAKFAIDHLEDKNGTSVESWIFPQDKKAGFYDYAIAPSIMDFFTEYIGEFPYAKLANVQSKTRYGGMENAGAIFYNETAISGRRESESLFAHEIAHQWFGDSVTEKDWPHIWLSEGFATYFTQLYLEDTYGSDRLMEGMKASRRQIVQFHNRAPHLAVIQHPKDLNQLLNANSYQKGGWFLHLLRNRIGDERFQAGIRKYYQTYRDQNANTDDLEAVMESASGQNLSIFFDQWLKMPGHPEISGSWSTESGELSILIEQRQNKLFAFPLELLIRYADGSTSTETFEITDKSSVFTVHHQKETASIQLDPNINLLFDEISFRRRN